MRLCIDIGNSRIKWGWSDAPGRVVDAGGCVEVSEMFAMAGAHAPPREILLADVRGGHSRELLVSRVRELGWPLPEPVISRERFEGLRIGYRVPESLGADRFLVLVASIPSRPAVVVSAGTALTVDGITADGMHMGGLIMPGLTAALESVNRVSAALRGGADPKNAALEPWGHDTSEAVGNGVLYAWVGGAEKAINDMREGLGGACAIILTGGDGRLLHKWLKFEAQYDELLVLRGMTYL
jgi:type III pantothenate kinase